MKALLHHNFIFATAFAAVKLVICPGNGLLDGVAFVIGGNSHCECAVYQLLVQFKDMVLYMGAYGFCNIVYRF